MTYEYKLPALGDGVTGKITEILVHPGDSISKEQIVVIVGTDKVDAEMPVDTAGTVEEILVKVGDDVGEGTPILRLKTGGAAAETPSPAAPAPASPAPAPAAPAAAPTPASAPPPAAPAAAPSTSGSLRTSPLARKRAKELGIDLADVRPQSGGDRISYKDVVDFVKRKIDTGGGSAAPGAAPANKPLPNFDKFGATDRQPQSRIEHESSRILKTVESPFFRDIRRVLGGMFLHPMPAHVFPMSLFP
jgi:pyruvate dehydrogenase E2 component (dihydrolipoamide acetyltransferase)